MPGIASFIQKLLTGLEPQHLHLTEMCLPPPCKQDHPHPPETMHQQLFSEQHHLHTLETMRPQLFGKLHHPHPPETTHPQLLNKKHPRQLPERIGPRPSRKKYRPHHLITTCLQPLSQKCHPQSLEIQHPPLQGKICQVNLQTLRHHFPTMLNHPAPPGQPKFWKLLRLRLVMNVAKISRTYYFCFSCSFQFKSMCSFAT